MTTRTASIVATNTRFSAIATVIAAGVMLFALTSFSQAAALHDTAHDQRHAMAFPCH